jgi:hypothetical protein
MSKYVNHVRTAEVETTQKPVTTQYALVVVEEAAVEKFDILMDAANDRWAGELFTNYDGHFVGWVYTARGANITDIDRKLSVITDVDVFAVTRNIQWETK